MCLIRPALTIHKLGSGAQLFYELTWVTWLTLGSFCEVRLQHTVVSLFLKPYPCFFLCEMKKGLLKCDSVWEMLIFFLSEPSPTRSWALPSTVQRHARVGDTNLPIVNELWTVWIGSYEANSKSSFELSLKENSLMGSEWTSCDVRDSRLDFAEAWGTQNCLCGEHAGYLVFFWFVSMYYMLGFYS